MHDMKRLILLTGFAIALNANAQVEPDAEVDSAIIIEEEIMEIAPNEYEEVIEADDYTGYAEATEAPAYAMKQNAFKHDQKIKPVSNPEKTAKYSLGNESLFKGIYEMLTVPYADVQTSSTKFVILKVTVGKDSQLYNPEFVITPGAVYSYNAQEAVEMLPGKFIPAKKGGKDVDSTLYIPIRFDYLLFNNRYFYTQPEENSDY